MVEKLTFHPLAAARGDIPAVSMAIACYINPLDICDIVLSDSTAHFRAEGAPV